MGTVLVDGIEVEVADNERLNGIQAAKRAGIDIPFYCWHPGLTVVASCRMCLVETGTRNPENGAVTMVPKLVPACQTPAKPGTVFVTNSELVKQSRARVEEDLLIDHPIDCPICDKAGECLLQDYHFEHGQKERRADIRPFTSRRREMGPTVTLFVDRCVMCSRCVRFTREISGTKELFVINRGSHEEIDVFPGHPLNNKMSGNVVDLCPVGALGDKDFLYSQRVWFMKSHSGVCAGCSTGCSVKVDVNQDTLYRLRPRENPHINKWWMCDEGRYGWHHVHDPARLTDARRRDVARASSPLPHGQDAHATYVNVEWSALPDELDAKLRAAGRLAVAISPHLTVEEAYLLARLARQYDSEALLALGPVPAIGGDERFPSGFTIHAEKCPNRRGVEAVLAKFTGGVSPFDELLKRCEAGEFKAAWISGGYHEPWIDEATAARLAGAPLLIVQDLFDSPLWQMATYQLPGASFAERSGSYVNFADRLQSFDWAIRPPAGVWVEGNLYWRMLGMDGMYQPRRVLEEVASEIGYFSAAGGAPVPEVGVDLKVNLLAGATA
jgi:NADH-quinone oxidoreductase subunit G